MHISTGAQVNRLGTQMAPVEHGGGCRQVAHKTAFSQFFRFVSIVEELRINH